MTVTVLLLSTEFRTTTVTMTRRDSDPVTMTVRASGQPGALRVKVCGRTVTQPEAAVAAAAAAQTGVTE